ncbi:MAG: hypothetical protein JWL73_2990 [Actinomycetia bacterium]|nr:hypothetical protein [Actinomycetes bacterium]
MGRCKVYEIEGPDPGETAGAVRCLRDATATIEVGDKKYPICKKHQATRWRLFKKKGWLYAVESKA